VPAPPASRSARRLALAALLVAAAAILVTEAIGDSVTVDEFGHLPAGVYYLETGHFDVYNLSPPLLRELAALPVLAARPAGDFTRFTTSPMQWGPGYEFMEGNRDRYHLLFVLGRLPMVALALALVVAVYLCGVRHLGTRPGLAAAALASFCPTLLAHGHLVGTDVGAALAMFLAAWAAFEALRAPSARRTLLAGLALGAAELTKFSALTLYPMLAALALVASVRGPRRWQPWGVVAAAGALSLVIVNAGYLGHGSGTPLAAYTPESPGLRTLAKGALGALPLPLPADLVRGFDHQRVEATGLYPVYFDGVWSTRGWWYYYPAAFALKETVPMLGLLAAGLLALAAGRATRDPLLAAFLVVPPALFTLLFTLLTDIDLGVRYLLPAYPFLFLVGGCALAPGVAARVARAATALVFLHMLVAVAATPHHLAYMNALAGPADARWRWLVDSNLDWGQELRRLRAYLARRGISSVRLVYFGRVAPEVYGIDYVVPNGPLGHGTFAVSASLLAGRPYFVWDHGKVYDAPVEAFAVFRRHMPTAVIGHSLFVYDF